jgi:hypothetical protein
MSMGSLPPIQNNSFMATNPPAMMPHNIVNNQNSFSNYDLGQATIVGAPPPPGMESGMAPYQGQLNYYRA